MTFNLLIRIETAYGSATQTWSNLTDFEVAAEIRAAREASAPGDTIEIKVS